MKKPTTNYFNLSPSAGPGGPDDKFWQSFLAEQPKGWAREVALLLLENLPAEWLKKVSDASSHPPKSLDLDDAEAGHEMCKAKALSVLWNTYYFCNRGFPAPQGCGSEAAVDAYWRCMEYMSQQ